jgi:hypothetical protein
VPISGDWRILVLATLALTTVGLGGQSSLAQTPARPPSPSHVVIPFLANAIKLTDLEFEGGECDVDASGTSMACAFQQVFLTTSQVAPDTCLVTTNRYERVFRRDSPTHWTSTEGPEGVCGLVDIATLQDDGTVKWTMELRKEVTKKDGGPACGTMKVEREVYSWQNLRRSLPCKFVQPGGLTP